MSPNIRGRVSVLVLFQEYTVDQQRTQWFSLYHSLQHYKYHTYLMCKDEVGLLHTGVLGWTLTHLSRWCQLSGFF